MIEIKGTYNTARVFCDELEPGARGQIQTLCDQPFAAGSKIRIMPDVHAGVGCTIGTTLTIGDKVVPNLVGVDIGCGMETVPVSGKRMELERLDKLIYSKIPSGLTVRDSCHPYNDQIDLTQLRCAHAVNLDRARKSIGTLGGGNHFIELDVDDAGQRYLVIHSGSRHLGLQVSHYYQEAGYQVLNRRDKQSIEALIETLKAQGREREISKQVKAAKKQVLTDIPKALAYVTGDLLEDYLHDMKLVQQFAELNRKAMVRELVKGMKWDTEEPFTTIHNYIDVEHRILRKGAVSAQAGETLLIPINMRDGSLLCVGKGNEDWNCSAPHGAGRLFSRAAARQQFTVSQFRKAMGDIYTTSVRAETLDECPMAYKSMETIAAQITPTAEISKVIRPIYNFKAGE